MNESRSSQLHSDAQLQKFCFKKEEFMGSDFDVDQFVLDCKRHTSMENLHKDLRTYHKILQTAMIELINKDYADFVNLSTNLVGLDKVIGNLNIPLQKMRSKVQKVLDDIGEVLSSVNEKVTKQEKLRRDKTYLQRLLSIHQSVARMEQLLLIEEDSPVHGHERVGELSVHLLERVATEFNQLQYNVNKTRQSAMVDKIKPRIVGITSALQQRLESAFLSSLESSDLPTLRRCLRTYMTIDKIHDVESLYRQNIVQVYMQPILNEDSLQENPEGLKGIYNKVLLFLEKDFQKISIATHGNALSGGQDEVVRGFDFLVNSVWPEIASGIETRMNSIFAPGNPNLFFKRYTMTMQFLDNFEKFSCSQATIKRLRSHTSYNFFLNKWSLPVYFQIRFQEIAGEFEKSLASVSLSVEAGSRFKLHTTQQLHNSLQHCWQSDIFLPSLVHRFWKLTLQLISRHHYWLKQFVENQDQARPLVDKSAANRRKELASDESSSSAQSGSEDESVGRSSAQVAELVFDIAVIKEKILNLYQETIVPLFQSLCIKDLSLFEESIQESIDGYGEFDVVLDQLIIKDISRKCRKHLKLINDIPRLYRRTNREAPSKCSPYVASITLPLDEFLKNISGSEKAVSWKIAILKEITAQFHSVIKDVLNSVKKMEESLKRLKKARGNTAASSAGMSDDDKIRNQILIDVQQFGRQMKLLDCPAEEITEYSEMCQLASSAVQHP